jgi:hypothetical protein
MLAFILANMTYHPNVPRPFGVFLDLEKPTYNDLVVDQIQAAKDKLGEGNLVDLMKGEDFWEIG